MVNTSTHSQTSLEIYRIVFIDIFLVAWLLRVPRQMNSLVVIFTFTIGYYEN